MRIAHPGEADTGPYSTVAGFVSYLVLANLANLCSLKAAL